VHHAQVQLNLGHRRGPDRPLRNRGAPRGLSTPSPCIFLWQDVDRLQCRATRHRRRRQPPIQGVTSPRHGTRHATSRRFLEVCDARLCLDHPLVFCRNRLIQIPLCSTELQLKKSEPLDCNSSPHEDKPQPDATQLKLQAACTRCALVRRSLDPPY
jgi:hypothetical protein